MLENPRRGRQAINFTTNVPKILDLKASFEQKCSENRRWVPLSKTNLEGVPNDPIIRGGRGQDKHFIFSTFCKLEIDYYLLSID